MKTEIVRHIFDGGVLNASGTEVPSQNVLQEGNLCQAFQTLLGKEESRNNCGAVSLQDWLRINNRKVIKKSKPLREHMCLGIPDEFMITCRKISSKSGPLYREGGFFIDKEGYNPNQL